MAFNKKTHLRRNIEALKTAFMLEREQRTATAEERDILAAYSGFGAIKEVLESPKNKSGDDMDALISELHEVIKADTPNGREYKRYMDGIKNSVLTAFYTPPQVAGAIVGAILQAGIAPQRILDPSAGTGIFVQSARAHAPHAEITCFEKDPATGVILKHLHPQSLVRIQGFERIEPKYAGYYDVAVSNIPFGDVALFDPFFSTHTDPVRRQGTRALHNYFFMKSVDTVREGGLVAFITSQGVLNSEQGRPVREWLMNRCDVVSAVRLPINLFSDHAGTDVGSDLIILQKKALATELSPRQRDFIESRKLSNGIRVNNLFRNFDRVIHTEAKVGTDPYGKPAMEFTHKGGTSAIANELRRMLSDDLRAYLDVDYYLSHAPADEVRRQTPQRPQLTLSVATESEETRIVAEMATQGYSLDIETGELTRIEQVQKPTIAAADDLADFGAWAAEKERRIWETDPPQPEDFNIAESADTEVQETSEFARRAVTEPVGSLFDIQVASQPEQVVAPQEPLLTLYDLFGFSSEERSQKNPKRKNRRPRRKSATSQPTIFSQPTSEERLPSVSEPASESSAGIAEHAAHDPEALYAGVNWEENPPINGFYEAMMRMTPEQRAAMRQQPSSGHDGATTATPDMSSRTTMQRSAPQEQDITPRPFTGKVSSHHRNGTLVADADSRIGYLRDLDTMSPMFHPLNLSPTQRAKASLYVEIRDTYFHLYENEAETQAENPALREMLNRLYDEFANRFGRLNDKRNLDLIKMDARGTEILALERYIDGKARKADIFDHPVAFNPNEITHAEDANEALVASLNKYGRVDLEYMASLTGATQPQMLEELKGRIYFNPLIEGYEIADKFIAGNVIEKADRVQAFLEQHPDDEAIRESLEALREATPKPIAFDDLDFNFGERWIPKGIYERFASALFDTEVKMSYAPDIDEYSVKASSLNAKILNQYAVDSQSRKYNGIHLLKHALQNTSPDIPKKVTKLIDGELKEVKVGNGEAIQQDRRDTQRLPGLVA